MGTHACSHGPVVCQVGGSFFGGSWFPPKLPKVELQVAAQTNFGGEPLYQQKV